LPGLKCGNQRCLVHHIAARDVDEMCMALHGSKHIRSNQVMRLGAAGYGHHNHIHLANQLRDIRHLLGREFHRFRRAVIILYLHPEPEMTALCNGLPDPAHADDADRFPA